MVLILAGGFFFLQEVHAQTRFEFGLTSRAEWNSFERQGTDGSIQKVLQTTPGSALGLVVGQSFGQRFFGELGVLTSKSNYLVNQAVGPAVFQKAELHFIQTNATINFWMGKDRGFRMYSFGGLQHLYRRWGAEYYSQSVISGSRWPNQRIQFQAGLGAKLAISDNWNLRVFGGLRYNPSHKLIYDNAMNQLFFGATLTYSWVKAKKSMIYRCPSF